MLWFQKQIIFYGKNLFGSRPLDSNCILFLWTVCQSIRQEGSVYCTVYQKLKEREGGFSLSQKKYIKAKKIQTDLARFWTWLLESIFEEYNRWRQPMTSTMNKNGLNIFFTRVILKNMSHFFFYNMFVSLLVGLLFVLKNNHEKFREQFIFDILSFSFVFHVLYIFVSVLFSPFLSNQCILKLFQCIRYLIVNYYFHSRNKNDAI